MSLPGASIPPPSPHRVNVFREKAPKFHPSVPMQWLCRCQIHTPAGIEWRRGWRRRLHLRLRSSFHSAQGRTIWQDMALTALRSSSIILGVYLVIFGVGKLSQTSPDGRISLTQTTATALLGSCPIPSHRILRSSVHARRPSFENSRRVRMCLHNTTLPRRKGAVGALEWGRLSRLVAD